jgi:hypothetical protein
MNETHCPHIVLIILNETDGWVMRFIHDNAIIR